MELLSAGSARHGAPLGRIYRLTSSYRKREGGGRNETSKEREIEKWWQRV
jgi:hypothetical protein